ncbi:hypothetical protein OG308_12835 [Nocardia salmonicida]|uniref:Uncharacterized protein n=1 Tax=Nocardia salmonicida TaxID=53431 RepID=A0ABZ1NFJ9_9NOCA
MGDDIDAAGPSDKGEDAVVLGDTDSVGMVGGGLPSHPANASVAAAISPTANRTAVTVISTPSWKALFFAGQRTSVSGMSGFPTNAH